MKLVDANAIEKELWRIRCQYQMLDDTQTADKIMHGLFRAEQVLKDAEIIDAEPVVRCKDCRWQGDDEHCPVCNSCGRGNLPSGDWYCADGERKDDE